MKAVLLDQQTFSADISLAAIKQNVTFLQCYATTSEKQIVERCIDAEIIITNKVIIDDEVMTKLPNLKLICIAATGTNNVDLIAAKSRNIAVTNVSGYSTASVTQYVFSQLLEYYSQTSHHNQNTDDGLWQASPTFCHLGNNTYELSGKTLGIIGYGNLGQSVATVAKAFGMNVIIAERQYCKTIRENRLSFEDVLAQADVITLHCPHTPETKHLVNSKTLALMKKSAVLINTARGAVIDNQALLQALTNKTIAYAALDVLDIEPPSADHPLICAKLANLKLTAHIAWASIEAQQRLIAGIDKNISRFVAGERFNRVD